jgi:hypothetical protein
LVYRERIRRLPVMRLMALALRGITAKTAKYSPMSIPMSVTGIPIPLNGMAILLSCITTSPHGNTPTQSDVIAAYRNMNRRKRVGNLENLVARARQCSGSRPGPPRHTRAADAAHWAAQGSPRATASRKGKTQRIRTTYEAST